VYYDCKSVFLNSWQNNCYATRGDVHVFSVASICCEVVRCDIHWPNAQSRWRINNTQYLNSQQADRKQHAHLCVFLFPAFVTNSFSALADMACASGVVLCSSDWVHTQPTEWIINLWKRIVIFVQSWFTVLFAGWAGGNYAASLG